MGIHASVGYSPTAVVETPSVGALLRPRTHSGCPWMPGRRLKRASGSRRRLRGRPGPAGVAMRSWARRRHFGAIPTSLAALLTSRRARGRPRGGPRASPRRPGAATRGFRGGHASRPSAPLSSRWAAPRRGHPPASLTPPISKDAAGLPLPNCSSRLPSLPVSHRHRPGPLGRDPRRGGPGDRGRPARRAPCERVAAGVGRRAADP